MFCCYREGNAAGNFDEASYTVLTRHLLRDGSITAHELEVLKRHLAVCFNDRRKHQFHLQLKNRLLHRTIKAFKVEWQQCKQVAFHPYYISDGSVLKTRAITRYAMLCVLSLSQASSARSTWDYLCLTIIITLHLCLLLVWKHWCQIKKRVSTTPGVMDEI